jgi:hypothetical protein
MDQSTENTHTSPQKKSNFIVDNIIRFCMFFYISNFVNNLIDDFSKKITQCSEKTINTYIKEEMQFIHIKIFITFLWSIFLTCMYFLMSLIFVSVIKQIIKFFNFELSEFKNDLIVTISPILNIIHKMMTVRLLSTVFLYICIVPFGMENVQDDVYTHVYIQALLFSTVLVYKSYTMSFDL